MKILIEKSRRFLKSVKTPKNRELDSPGLEFLVLGRYLWKILGFYGFLTMGIFLEFSKNPRVFF